MDVMKWYKNAKIVGFFHFFFALRLGRRNGGGSGGR